MNDFAGSLGGHCRRANPDRFEHAEQDVLLRLPGRYVANATTVSETVGKTVDQQIDNGGLASIACGCVVGRRRAAGYSGQEGLLLGCLAGVGRSVDNSAKLTAGDRCDGPDGADVSYLKLFEDFGRVYPAA